jgi:hypothetical protein
MVIPGMIRPRAELAAQHLLAVVMVELEEQQQSLGIMALLLAVAVVAEAIWVAVVAMARMARYSLPGRKGPAQLHRQP